jgi:hypothetical protein
MAALLGRDSPVMGAAVVQALGPLPLSTVMAADDEIRLIDILPDPDASIPEDRVVRRVAAEEMGRCGRCCARCRAAVSARCSRDASGWTTQRPGRWRR